MASLPDPQFQIGVSSGIYMAGRDPQLGSIVRKLGYALTRGADTIELAGDVPHEIDYTQGKEIRYIAEKQGLTLLFHGSLTVPMTMPERGEWRDAHDHLKKSIRSAVMGGCKYVNFHSCLHFWLEMMTYAGRKLSMAFVDHEGDFIGEILKDPTGKDDGKGSAESRKKLRNWFVEKHWDTWYRDILMDQERAEVNTEMSIKGEIELRRALEALSKREAAGEITPDQRVKEEEELRKQLTETRNKEFNEALKGKIREKLEKGGKWDSEELRAIVTVIDGYHIISHYLYYKNDPIWQRMTEMYKRVIDRYKTVKYARLGGEEFVYTPGGDPSKEVDYWVDAAWEQAEKSNDREFKEFFYAVCAAKYIEGHMKRVFEWMKKEDGDGLIAYIEREAEKDNKDELKKAAKNLKITLEIPDARDASYAGLYTICRVKQIYAAVKSMRETLKDKGGDRVFMLIDFEHITTQGFDAFEEIKEFVGLAPDAGEYILSLHVTKPTPLHHHIQVEIGDVDVYKLLYQLRTVGLGKHHTTYLIYERGGERDPFRQSVIAIRLMVKQLLDDIKPKELIGKPEFFGVEGPNIASEERQRTIISEHAEDPIKDLMVVPEEEHTFLGRAASGKPGGAEKWKKDELK